VARDVMGRRPPLTWRSNRAARHSVARDAMGRRPPLTWRSNKWRLDTARGALLCYADFIFGMRVARRKGRPRGYEDVGGQAGTITFTRTRRGA
jgi:hypothetical protein